jgi:hypothetical protein
MKNSGKQALDAVNARFHVEKINKHLPSLQHRIALIILYLNL